MDSPNNVPFTACVEFDCEDVGNNVQVRFRVFDESGFGECMVNVEVQDNIGPQISCPPDKTLNCSADFSVGALGEANFIDNCGEASITFADSGALDFCGQGTIIRTWTATDNGATSSSCVQTISIFKTAIATFTGNDVVGDDDDIIFPADIDLECTSFQNDNSLTDPANAGEPILVGEDDDCAQLFVGYSDQLLFNDPNSCLKILRTWTVTDNCQFDANSGSSVGLWQSIQIINVDDQTAPVFDDCSDAIANIEGDGCSGEVTITRTAVSYTHLTLPTSLRV